MSPSNRAPRGRTSRPSGARRTATPVAKPSRSNRTWIVITVVAVVALLAVVIAVAAAGGDEDAGKASKDAVQVAPITVTGTPLADFPKLGDRDPAVGATIPSLTGKSLFDGSDMTIEPTGKPMVIAFLAHWCPHCQAEVPVLVDLAKSGAFDGIDVRAVATGTNSQAPNYPPSSWLQGEKWPFPAMADSARSTAAVAYGLTGYPNLVFVDAGGKVVARSQGEVAQGVLTQALKDLQAGKSVSLTGGGSSSK